MIHGARRRCRNYTLQICKYSSQHLKDITCNIYLQGQINYQIFTGSLYHYLLLSVPLKFEIKVENTLFVFILLGAAAAHQHAIPGVASRIQPLNFSNESHVERNGWDGIDCETCNFIGRVRPIDNFAELFLITLTFVLGLMNFVVRR